MNKRAKRALGKTAKDYTWAKPSDFTGKACADSRFGGFAGDGHKQAVIVGYGQTAELSGEWRTWRRRTVSLSTAWARKERGELNMERRESNGRVVWFFQEREPLKPSLPTPCTLTMTVLHAVAGAVMVERHPSERLTGSERAHNDKYIMWPKIWDGKNRATVGPRISEENSRKIAAVERRADGPLTRFREMKPKKLRQQAAAA